MTPWLRVKATCFSRNKREILKNISVEFSEGELILLTGHNGSGKTTLLRIIAGLLKPDQGLFELNGGPWSNWRFIRNSLRQNTCYLHQQPYLFDCSVFNNVAYGLRRQGVGQQEITSRVTAALEAASLDHLQRRHSRELSGGEQQRVAMVRAWVLTPRLMLLDEPVANMDKQARRLCLSLINQLYKDKVSVILTSHDPQQGELQLTRHLHLYQGSMEPKPIDTLDKRDT
ncbi:MAG: energy-coupling factor ABC transporter ATP-binding protein [Gammaproteobacteria bacterium]|nr:energy-coupling factor ABC transporter ATP-binding protein [Gammaproteobacteria bacterium]